jgi:hypothetical protein
MTPYHAKDLAEGWEFKILRNATGRFSDPLWLKAVLDEEGRAGWVFLEKFDNYRIRLKRPASARERDAVLGFDPYRSWVGIGQARLVLLIVAGVFVAVAIIMGALAAILGGQGPH